MKWILFLMIVFSNPAMSQHSIYTVQYKSLDGSVVNMASFAGKKILVAAISPDNLEKGGLTFLDSLQKAHPEISVIIIPSEDFGGKRDKEILQTIKARSSKNIKVSAASRVKKGPKTVQHPLMRWLTSADENAHFGADVNTDNQIYVISESGVLYAVLEKGVSAKLIEEVINDENVKSHFR